MAISLELAVSAIKAGRKDEGRQLLNLLIQQNPNNENAWLWMSSVVHTDEQRARCLYHVLAINPNNQMARKGLNVLGIVVSDSRPVKIPRDSQPIKIPKPTQDSNEVADAPQERRPFLIDPKTVTQEMPFAPLNPPFAPVQASPAILAIDVEQAAIDDNASDATPPKPAGVTATQSQNMPATTAQGSDLVLVMENETPGSETDSQPGAGSLATTTPANTGTDKHKQLTEVAGYETKTQKMPSPFEQLQAKPNQEQKANALGQSMQPSQVPAPSEGNKQPMPVAAQADQPDNQQSIPNDTRPSHPVQLDNMALMQNNQSPFGGQLPAMGYHSQVTMGMPNQSYAPPPSQPYPMPQPPLHSNPTMGMPYPYDYGRPPSEPVPAIHSSATMGMTPYGQPQYQPGPQTMAFHSNATMMMPTMSEAEARARLNGSQSIPTANGLAMPLQSNSWQSAPYPAPPQPTYVDDEEEDEGESNEINVLAVVIFGTLSLTAMGGLGMLVLLIFTTPA